MATRSVMGMPRPPFDQTFPGGGGTDGSDPASQMFDQFCCANTFQGIMDSFSQLCRLVGLRPSDHRVFYHQLKTRLNSWKAQTLWVKLDKRSQGWEYGKGLACSNTSVSFLNYSFRIYIFFIFNNLYRFTPPLLLFFLFLSCGLGLFSIHF